MKKKDQALRPMRICLVMLILAASILNTSTSLAAEGRCKVYKTDPVLTPAPEEVILEDLDESGYLNNQYLTFIVKAPSRYDFLPYALDGNFIYEPVRWDFNNISEEGIKFDMASTYYYLTLCRKYFESHFGFKQSTDGITIEPVYVYMFFDDLSLMDYRVPLAFSDSRDPRSQYFSLPAIFYPAPGDPYLSWAPDYYRACWVVMHEYCHIVFMRYLQNNMFTGGDNTEACFINEVLASFWPATIMDEPRYGGTLWPTWMKEVDFSKDVKYDPAITDPELIISNRMGSLVSALWDLREHPRIGKTNAEKIIYDAMRLVKHEDATFADFAGACLNAKAMLPEKARKNIKDEYIIGVFAEHNIAVKMTNDITVADDLSIAHRVKESADYPKGREESVDEKGALLKAPLYLYEVRYTNYDIRKEGGD